MFDATAGRKAIADKIDQMTDRFAAEFEDRMSDLSAVEQEALVVQLLQVMSGTDSARSFATNNAGQPAAQLGTGSQSDPKQQMAEALNAFGASPGQAQAILRILNAPRDPRHIEVEADGTPSELVATRRERDAARTELTRERDESHNGSLAKQLADVTAERDRLTTDLAAARNSAGGYDQALARPVLDEVDQAVEDLVGKMGGRVEGKSELKQKINALLRAVHLTRA